jgi:DNA-binding transcriptional ArsR family regulator
MKQKYIRREGQFNRNRIINELIKSPLTFTALKKKVGLSSKTLTQHLKNLQDESLVKREIQGKYIVYKVNVPQTRLSMRKFFLSELDGLIWVYWDSLDKDTSILLNKVREALDKSIKEPEPNASLKIIEKTIPFPIDKERSIVKQDLTNLYEKPQSIKPAPKRKPKLMKRES